MPFFPLEVPHVEKPADIAPEINWDNPYTESLVAAFIFNESTGSLVDLVTGKVYSSVSGISSVITEDGDRAVDMDGTQLGFDIDGTYDLSNGFSIIARVTNSNNGVDLGICGADDSASPLFQWWRDENGGSDSYGVAITNSAAAYKISYGSIQPSQNEIHTAAINIPATTTINHFHQVFYNGVEESYRSQDISNLHSGFATTPIRIGTVSGKKFQGEQHFLYLFDRPSSDEKIKSVSESPWQLIKPETIHIPLAIEAAAFQAAWAQNSTLTQGIEGVSNA